MFVEIPENLKAHVEDVSPPCSRVQAITFKTEQRQLLILNTYFPQDPKTSVLDAGDLLTTIEAIYSVLQKNEFKELIWTGDINADFSRATKFVQVVRNFLEENGLIKAWEKFEVDFTHANNVDNITHVSTIDHFFWNKGLDTNIIPAGVLHLPGNLSDHSPNILHNC